MANASLKLGNTEVFSEASGVVTLKNATLDSSVTINAGSNVSGIGQLIGFSFSEDYNTAGNIVTLESSKSYDAFLSIYSSGGNLYFNDLAYATVDSSGTVTVGKHSDFGSLLALESPGANQVRVKVYNSTHGYHRVLIFERGSTFYAS